MDLKGVFNAEPRSLFDTVGEAGLCFYLPAYQRPYSWNKKNVARVFEDVIHGMANSIRNEDAITFIGTILTIHDTKYQTITPVKRSDVPAKVMLVIDGQQRLTTMLLIVATLHEYLSVRENKLQSFVEKLEKELQKEPEDEELKSRLEAFEWLLDKLNQEIANLRHFSTNTNSNRDQKYKWYPKIIRAYTDCWSKTELGAMYSSPAAAYFHEYNLHVLACEADNKFKKFEYKIDEKSKDADKHKVLRNNVREIRLSLNKVSKNEDSEGGQPTVKELINGEFSSSFQIDIPDELLRMVDDDPLVRGSLNLFFFSKYLLNRVCVTYVAVTDEAYAFDMFEALNTTGEPLTSIETFKPKVIEAEGLNEYESSKSKKYMDGVDEYLERFSDATKKHKETTRLMLSFALSETGEKISKHISDQRRYLIEEYKLLNSIEEKRQFIRCLDTLSSFYMREWDADSPEILSDGTDEKNQLLLLFSLLRESGHEITIPILARYYDDFKEDRSDKNRNELLKAIRSVVAFFVLWRAAHKNTANIDSVYREILKSGVEEVGLPPFCFKTKKTPSAAQLAAGLRKKLEKKILGERDGELKERWISLSKNMPVYNISKPLTRFLMLAALDDTSPSAINPGMVDRSTPGFLPLLSWHKWKLFGSAEPTESRFTIEHVAPQHPSAGWSSTIDDDDLINSLGNLTILPGSVNSSVGNDSWKKKKDVFSVLCKENAKEKEEMAGKMKDAQKLILEKSKYLGFLSSLHQVAEWDRTSIEKRSENLLSNVWEKVYPWLT